MSTLAPNNRRGHLVRLLGQRRGRVFLRSGSDDHEDFLIASKNRLFEILAFFKNDPDAAMTSLLDIFGTTISDDETHIYYRLRSPRLGYRLRVRIELTGEDLAVPSVATLFGSASWLERELYEMYGVYPEGHADLRPLFLYEGFAGHPGRDDYPQDKNQPLVPRRDYPAPRLVRSE